VTPSGKKRESNASVSSGSLRSKRSTRTSNSAFNYTGSLTPSLLNGSGDGKSIPSGAGARHSEGGISIPSPAQSRSSSAQDSYSTSATTFEETDDAQPESKRSSRAKEGKGNVIVGVRVRPDSAGNDTVKADGEWMVDGRRSLVAYRGREGGNYYYGEYN
jgi:centromeric protein E